MNSELKLRIVGDKLALYRANYAVGCNRIHMSEVLLQMGQYAQASRKLLKAMQNLGYSKVLKEKIRNCNEKINEGTNEMREFSPETEIAESMEERRQLYYGEACEAFKCGNIEDAQRNIKDVLFIDPKFIPGRILKFEVKLVATFKKPWKQIILDKDLFLSSVTLIPPMELWKPAIEHLPQAGPSEQSKEDTSDEVNGEHFYSPPSKRMKEY